MLVRVKCVAQHLHVIRTQPTVVVVIIVKVSNCTDGLFL